MRDIDFLRTVKTLAWREFVLFPKANLVDYYKMFFQGTFGPGHIIENRDSAYQSLLSEYPGSSLSELPFVQDISFINPYCRISLEVLEKQMLGIDEFTDILMESCHVVTSITPVEWNEAWQDIQEILFVILPKLHERELVQLIREQSYGDRIQVFRHSEVFRNSYNPHYRLIRKDLIPNHIKLYT